MIYAKYTIVLKTLLDDPKSKELIDEAMSTYPLYTPEQEPKFTKILTREEINQMILNHFKYREIGFETFGRFLDELRIALEEIMPTYNQLFCSQDIINGLEDIFGNVDMEVTFEQEVEGNTTNDTESSQTGSVDENSNITSTSEASDSSTTTSTMGSDSKNVTSNTPQSELAITSKNIDNVSYADQVQWNKSDSESSATTQGSSSSEGTNIGVKHETQTQEGTINHTEVKKETTKNTIHRKGNQGVQTYAHDMLEFRELFVNVVQKIIADIRIQELFMGVY